MKDVIKQFPDSKTSAHAYRTLAGISNNVIGNNDLAKWYIFKAEEVNKNDNVSLLRAEANRINGNLDEAINQYTILVKSKDLYYSDVDAVSLCVNRGRLDDALALSELGLKKKHEYSWQLHRLRGEAYYKKNMYQEAARELSIAIALCPGDYLSYALRSAVYRAMGNNQKANADREISDHLGIFNPNIHLNSDKDPEKAVIEGVDYISGW